MEEAYRRMQNVPLSDWSAARYMDLELSVQWLLEHAPQGQVRAATMTYGDCDRDFDLEHAPQGQVRARAGCSHHHIR